MTNLDVCNPSVDPKQLLLEFNKWLRMRENNMLYHDGVFTDFALFTWVYESSNIICPIVNGEKLYCSIDELRKDIQLLLAAWTKAGYLHISHGNNSETLFSFSSTI